jgi:hypothetical protein
MFEVSCYVFNSKNIIAMIKMLVSISCFQKAMVQYHKAKKYKEKYSVGDSAGGGVSAGVATGSLMVAVFFMALEFLVLFFAIGVAMRCSKGVAERIVHLVLAITFTLPYMLFSVFFSKCATDMLRGSQSIDVIKSPADHGGNFAMCNKLN